MIRLSLFWKIFGSFLAIIVLTALLAGWLANARIVEDVEHETGATLHTQLVLLQEIFGDAFTGADDPALQERVRGLGKRIGTRITLVDATGRVLADSSKDPVGMENHGNRPEVLASRTAESGRSSRYSATLGMQMMYVARRIERDGTT
jgi:two-component system phosphate regulon sensor histidine kinase PhoR